MLKAHESLYEKELEPMVEHLIYLANSGMPYTPNDDS